MGLEVSSIERKRDRSALNKCKPKDPEDENLRVFCFLVAQASYKADNWSAGDYSQG